MGERRSSRPTPRTRPAVPLIAAAGWLLLAVPTGWAQQDCTARLAQLEQSRHAVEELLGQVEAVVAGLEEQLATVRDRLEASEDPDERARLEELAIRLAEQVQRARDQRDEIRRQLTTFEEAIDALGKCGR